jgi:hypothetical protein
MGGERPPDAIAARPLQGRAGARFMRQTIFAAALAALTISASVPDAQAQAGRRYYCGSGESTATCGPSGNQGIANSCAASGCHSRNPLNDASGRAMRGAGSPGTIMGSPDGGMQAALMSYTPAEIDAIAAWLLTLATGGSQPSCSVTASNPTPNTGTSITLTASCTNSPTGYAWTNCTSTTSTCTATRSVAGNVTYSVTASNASGASSPASVTVGWTTPGGPPPPPPPPPEAPPPTTTVVEYFHAGMGHYFITGFPGEITFLDAGTAGWARTGRSFLAYSATNGPQAPVCRFFTAAFAPKSSHFYTPSSEECNGLRSSSQAWQYEADSFYVRLADSVSGSCPTGTQPVYRLYNDGQTGAPNHRYTTDHALRTQLMGQRWTPEGYGPEGVSFCVPF